MGLASNRTIAFLLIVTAIAAPSITLATNGYFLIGYGAKSRSMGGVGVAYGQDGLAADQASSSAGLASSSTVLSSPERNISTTMSQPPMSSPFT